MLGGQIMSSNLERQTKLLCVQNRLKGGFIIGNGKGGWGRKGILFCPKMCLFLVHVLYTYYFFLLPLRMFHVYFLSDTYPPTFLLLFDISFC